MPNNNIVAYPEQAKRIAEKIQKNPQIPQGYGQYAWFQKEFKRRFDYEPGREVVRTWINGLREPHATRRAQLAEILGVDVGWLMTGISSPSIGRTASAAAEVVVAMMLQAGGWKVHNPDDRTYDLDAELRGRRYKIECTQVFEKDGVCEVKMSRHADNVITVATFIDPAAGVLTLLQVEGEPGMVVRFNGHTLDTASGTVTRLSDLTKPI